MPVFLIRTQIAQNLFEIRKILLRQHRQLAIGQAFGPLPGLQPAARFRLRNRAATTAHQRHIKRQPIGALSHFIKSRRDAL